MKFGVIRQSAGEHGVRKLCRTLGVARSAGCSAQKKPERPRAKADARLEDKGVRVLRGQRRHLRQSKAWRWRCGERARGAAVIRLARLMARAGLRARQKRRFRPRTTDSRHLCLVARAFERAIALHQPAPGLLHHSDRGSQDASDAYRELLRPGYDLPPQKYVPCKLHGGPTVSTGPNTNPVVEKLLLEAAGGLKLSYQPDPSGTTGRQRRARNPNRGFRGSGGVGGHPAAQHAHAGEDRVAHRHQNTVQLLVEFVCSSREDTDFRPFYL